MLKVERADSIKSLLVKAGFVNSVLLSKQSSLIPESPDLNLKKIWSDTSGVAEIYARKPLISEEFYQIDALMEELKERDLNARVTTCNHLKINSQIFKLN